MLGCLDTELAQRPLLHVFVAEKPSWSEIFDQPPQLATTPASRADVQEP